MLDYKSIIIKRYALGLSYKELAEEFSASKSVNNGELVPSARSNCTTLPKQEYRLAGWLYRSATVLCQRCEPLFR